MKVIYGVTVLSPVIRFLAKNMAQGNLEVLTESSLVICFS